MNINLTEAYDYLDRAKAELDETPDPIELVFIAATHALLALVDAFVAANSLAEVDNDATVPQAAVPHMGGE